MVENTDFLCSNNEILCVYDSVAASIFFIIANIMTAATRQRPMSIPQFAISGILFQSFDGIIER